MQSFRFICGLTLMLAGTLGYVNNTPAPSWVPICFGLYVISHWLEQRYPPRPSE